MLGHLKAEDFMNLLEGTALTGWRLDHLQSCGRCKEKFESVQAVRLHIAEIHLEDDDYIAEPDWSEFRSDVRNALLSRSVKREQSARRLWQGLPRAITLKPVWGLAALLVFALTLTAVLWNQRETAPLPATAGVEDLLTEEENMNSLAGMSRTDVFDDLVRLNADEADSLQMILEDITQSSVSQQ
jgi:hypothetical protein